MAGPFNNTGRMIAKYIVYATIDESRKRTPNKNHNPESGNVIPNTNHAKPIHNAYEIHDVACARDNITFGMRPTYGAQDQHFIAYENERKLQGVKRINPMYWGRDRTYAGYQDKPETRKATTRPYYF